MRYLPSPGEVAYQAAQRLDMNRNRGQTSMVNWLDVPTDRAEVYEAMATAIIESEFRAVWEMNLALEQVLASQRRREQWLKGEPDDDETPGNRVGTGPEEASPGR